MIFPHKFSADNRFAFFDFIKDGIPLENAPLCGMTLLKAGSMRFRWNEINPLRNKILKEAADFPNPHTDYESKKIDEIKIVPVELIHSKIVCNVNDFQDTKNIQADGIITANKSLMPVVTVADCMPLYIYDSQNQVFGIVHSGWKGTGIVAEAIKTSCQFYNSQPENISVILGPHIHDCCYIVNEERAEYFSKEFTPDCVKELEKRGTCYAGGRGLPITWNNGEGKLYRLSLEKANLAVLEKQGIPSENINVINECTCCNTIFGSNRRETAEWKSTGGEPPETDAGAVTAPASIQHFTVQGCFIHW